MTFKLLAAALGAVGVAWCVSPAPASAMGPAAPHAQNLGEQAGVTEVRHRRWHHRRHHRRCFWHRHRGHGVPYRHTHRHCRWRHGGPSIIITL